MGPVGQVGGGAYFHGGGLDGRRRGVRCEASARNEENDGVARDHDVCLEQQRVAYKTASGSVWFQKSRGVVEVAAAAEAAAARAEHEKPRAKGVHMSQMFLLLLLFLFHELFSSCPMVVFVFSSCSVWRERRGSGSTYAQRFLVVGLTNASAPKPHLRPLCNTSLRRHRQQAVGWKCTEIVWESDGVRHLAPGSMLVIQARHIYC